MERRREIVEQLAVLKTSIEASKAFIDRMPFFARGFAVQDFTSSTGLSFDEWLRLLSSTIDAVQASAPLAQQHLTDIRELAAHLERYAQYALSIPDKLRIAAQFITIEKEVLESAERAPKLAEIARQLKQNLEALMREVGTNP